jgi:hypothetical protein
VKEKPVNEKPVNEKPVNDKPVNDEPVNDEPVNEDTSSTETLSIGGIIGVTLVSLIFVFIVTFLIYRKCKQPKEAIASSSKYADMNMHTTNNPLPSPVNALG